MFCLFTDAPATAQVPPLTPGTTQKMSQALLESFKSFEKDQQRLSIPKGNSIILMAALTFSVAICIIDVFPENIFSLCETKIYRFMSNNRKNTLRQ